MMNDVGLPASLSLSCKLTIGDNGVGFGVACPFLKVLFRLFLSVVDLTDEAEPKASCRRLPLPYSHLR
jgi:hypothetical protein